MTNVTIGNSVTLIDEESFINCIRLTNIIIPDSVTSIGIRAFDNCSGLTSVTIGNGVTSINSMAFYECRSLMSITIEATTPPTLASYTSFYNTNNCPIYVPSQSVEAYKTADIWKDDYASRIQAIPTT